MHHRACAGPFHTRLPEGHELSLRRLAKETRERIRPLAVIHGGTHGMYLADLLGIDVVAESNAIGELMRDLVGVGLVQPVQSGNGVFLELDPALPGYLLRSIPKTELHEYRRQWNHVVLMGVLELVKAHQTEYAADVHLRIVRELPNITASLRDAESDVPSSLLVVVASFLEDVCTWVGRADVVALAREIREKAAAALQDWSHEMFLAEEAHVTSLLQQLQPLAVSAAENLVMRCQDAGENAFPEAAYDLGMAYHRLGWAYGLVHDIDRGLVSLDEAMRRFQILSSQGDTDATGMIVSVLIEKVNLLETAGRLDEAATHAEQVLELAATLKMSRNVSLAKYQLGKLRLAQGRPRESLSFLHEALEEFQELNEWETLTSLWSLIGHCYRDTNEYEKAEDAFRESLSLSVQHKLARAEAECLNGLARLYETWGRTEEAAACYLTAADRVSDLDEEYSEVQIRFRAVFQLMGSGQTDEARVQLNRVIEFSSDVPEESDLLVAACGMLYEVEKNSGTAEAQSRSYELVRSAYNKKRHSSSSDPSGLPQVVMPGQIYITQVKEAIEAGWRRKRRSAALPQELSDIVQDQGQPPQFRVLASKLIRILDGERDVALARDQALHYQDAVELELMLDGL